MSEPIPAETTSEAGPHSFEMTASSRPWVFVATLSTLFMAAIETTIVATAMPSIVGSLGGFEFFSWVFTSYLLTQAVMIPIYGRLADLYGRKRILFIGIGLFLIGSVLCGLAWSMISLVAFRVVQGIGAGAVMPVAQTLLGDVYRGADRARMQGYVSSVFGGAAILGPVVGAFIVAHMPWSMVFWINVPLGIIAAAMLALTLHERLERQKHRVDYVGSALMTFGTGVLMFTLVQATTLGLATIFTLIAASIISLAMLLIYERTVPEPMLPVTLWRSRIVAGSNVVNLATGAAMMGITAFLPAYMQGVMGTSTIVAGLALTAMSAGWPVGGFTSGRVMLRFSFRTTAAAGGFVFVIGSLMLIALDPARGPLWAIASASLIGFGMGLANNCYMVAVQASVAWRQRGIATSSIVFTRIFGQAVGTAVFGGILNSGLSGHLSGHDDIVNRLMVPALRQSLPMAEIEPVMRAFSDALHNVYLISGVMALIVLVTALGLPAGLGLSVLSRRASAEPTTGD